MTRPLVLASNSPRRRELLAAAGLKFEIVVPAVMESASGALSMCELTSLNAFRKAMAAAELRPEAIILGADTLVSYRGETIGKPRDLRHAFKILRRLSGREHQVCTSVCITKAASPLTNAFSVVSHVQFRSLSDSQIRTYLEKIDPLDKAGAYAAQGNGTDIIRRIRGSFTNVVGLPMEETLKALRAFGVTASLRRDALPRVPN